MATVIEERTARIAQLLGRLPVHHDRLRRAATVAELLGRGAGIARAECDFARGLVVSVREGQLMGDATGVLDDTESDLLRRRLLSRPLAIPPHSLEADMTRRAGRARAQDLPSTLTAELSLEDPAFGVLAPDGRTIGILVLDRPGRQLDETDRSVVELFGGMLGVVLEQVVLRARIAEFSTELRHLTVSVQALAAEAIHAPITLPTQGRHLPVFRTADAPAPVVTEQVKDLLTEREAGIAALLAQGRSNPEIAERLFLSVETVKDNVGRIARKLGAANRVEAALRFLELAEKPPGGGR